MYPATKVRQDRGYHGTMKNLLIRFIHDDEAQDIIEYALLAAFVSIAAYVLLTTIGQNVNTIYTVVNTATSSAAS